MPYQVTPTALPEVLILEPTVFSDARGEVFESFNQREFTRATGVDVQFVQDNHSRSKRHVLRGLHYQHLHAQGKLVRVIAGEIFDVAVDVRRASPTFGHWVGVNLSAHNRKQLWIPPGFAHGFLVLSECAEVLYKTTDYWHPEYECVLAWNDAQVGIEWALQAAPLLSEKDRNGKSLQKIQLICP